MGLVYRNGRPYFYRYTSRAGRTVCHYLGSGVAAEELASREKVRRQEARAAKAAWESQRAVEEAIEAEVVAFDRAATRAYRDAMQAFGFHIYDRHLRRKGKGMRTAAVTDQNQARRLTMPADSAPAGARESTGCDLDAAFGNALIEAMTEAPTGRERIRQRMAWMRGELLGPTATAIEAVLAEQVLVCWLDLSYARFQSYLHESEERTGQVAGDWYGRRVTRAQKRFLAACKALVTVRREALPSIFEAQASEN